MMQNERHPELIPQNAINQYIIDELSIMEKGPSACAEGPFGITAASVLP